MQSNQNQMYAELLKHYQVQNQYGGSQANMVQQNNLQNLINARSNPNFANQITSVSRNVAQNAAAFNVNDPAYQRAILLQQVQQQQQQKQREQEYRNLAYQQMQAKNNQQLDQEQRNRLAAEARIARQRFELDKKLGFKTQLLDEHRLNIGPTPVVSNNGPTTSRNPTLTNQINSNQQGPPRNQSITKTNGAPSQVGAPKIPPQTNAYANPNLSTTQLIKQHQKQMSAQTYNPNMQQARRSLHKEIPHNNTTTRSQSSNNIRNSNSDFGGGLSNDILMEDDD